MSKEYAASDVALRIYRQFTNKAIERAWKEALYNPDVAKQLATMTRGSGPTPIQFNRLHTYLLAVGVHDATEPSPGP